ncbi:MAG: hypothetical protein Q4B44_07260 [Erysipelotrichaceae bacterium]|nr:hypothetical protein [Erysipelotrichaceae bacterium]
MHKTDYREAVYFRKREYNRNGWNELIIKAADLIALTKEKDVSAVCEGMLKNMLEGDRIVNGSPDKPSADLEIAYYCDNLSESRRRLY